MRRGACLRTCDTNPNREQLTAGEGQAPRKQFFFEKKNQKTFICFGQHLTGLFSPEATGNSQKFFGSFFQKRTVSLLGRP
jgi:hypothetical protein